MNIDQESRGNTITQLHNGLAALCAVGTILLILRLLKYSAYGFDFTDEGFYLQWIADPYKYSWPATQFGFIYHPIYSLFDGDITALRRFNVMTTFVLAWVLCHIFTSHIGPTLKAGGITRLTVSAGLATSSLVLFESSLITPNYNSLNSQALLITGIGLILADKSAQRLSIIGWILIAIGGWLAFMAKPSTALALGVITFFYLLFSRKFSIRMFALTLVCSGSLFLLSALLFDGSVVEFIRRLKLGVEFSMLQGGGYEPSKMLRIDSFNLEKRFVITFLLVVFTLLIALFSSLRGRSEVGLLISVIFFSITALFTLGQIERTAGLGPFQGLLMFAVISAMAIISLVFGGLQGLNTVSRQQWATAAFFLILPHIYAFGTNGNYWHHGSFIAVFWLLAGLTILRPVISGRPFSLLLMPIAITVQAITTTLLQSGFENPYRQPHPLRLNSSILEIGPQKSRLVLSQGYADYIANVVSVAREAEFEAKTPVLDLTGQSPGVIYAMGAESIGQAWIIGGYPGSLKFAQAALANTQCEKISLAWILFEPNGPRSIPTEVMLSMGVDFFSAYQKVGVWQIAEGAGGYKNRHTQELYKPKDSQEILYNCQIERQKKLRIKF
jgi:hypothetical protein